jgi:hypothetical protein
MNGDVGTETGLTNRPTSISGRLCETRSISGEFTRGGD